MAHPLVTNVHKPRAYTRCQLLSFNGNMLNMLKISNLMWTVKCAASQMARSNKQQWWRTAFSYNPLHVSKKPWNKCVSNGLSWVRKRWFDCASVQRMETDILITCFGNATKTIQPCWKIDNQQFVLGGEKVVARSKSILTEFTRPFWKYWCQICRYIHTQAAGQMTSRKYYRGNVYRPFSEQCLSCHNTATICIL